MCYETSMGMHVIEWNSGWACLKDCQGVGDSINAAA